MPINNGDSRDAEGGAAGGSKLDHYQEIWRTPCAGWLSVLCSLIFAVDRHLGSKLRFPNTA